MSKKRHEPEQYSEEEQELFASYHSKFKLGSKPAAHIAALAELSDEDLLKNLPASFNRLADAVPAFDGGGQDSARTADPLLPNYKYVPIS